MFKEVTRILIKHGRADYISRYGKLLNYRFPLNNTGSPYIELNIKGKYYSTEDLIRLRNWLTKAIERLKKDTKY